MLHEGQQEAHLRKVHTQKLSFILGSPKSISESDIGPGVSSPERIIAVSGLSNDMPDSPVSSVKNSDATPVPILAVSSKEFASRVELPGATVQAIWQKAILLKTRGV